MKRLLMTALLLVTIFFVRFAYMDSLVELQISTEKNTKLHKWEYFTGIEPLRGRRAAQQRLVAMSNSAISMESGRRIIPVPDKFTGR